MTKSRGIYQARRYWTDEELQVLRSEYSNAQTDELAARLGRPVHSVYHKAGKLGLTKSDAYIEEKKRKEAERLRRAGEKNRFKKGTVPPNKGLRRPGWAAGRMRDTQFKRGHRPHNWRYPIGSTRLIDGYQYTKVREASPWTKAWRLTHYLLWEEAGREIPPGHALRFKDGDRRNITLDNLELIYRGDLMRRNSVHNLPKDLAQVVQLRGALVRQINKRARHEKQD